MSAELVLYNGTIRTLDDDQPRASAVAAHHGVIIYVGDDVTARGLLVPGGEAVDLRGACVVPGLTDAHLHMLWIAQGLQRIDAELPDPADVVRRVAERVPHTPAGGWVTGYGWNHNAWGGEFPTKEPLDYVAPAHPVLLYAKSGHAAWVNSRALAEAGISVDTPDPEGGRILRDASGEANGILLENAVALVAERVPQPDVEQAAAMMRDAVALANRSGLTSVHDMDGPLALSAHQMLHARGELTLRVLKSVPIEYMRQALDLGLRSGWGDDLLRLGHVKMFVDGALGPRTALMLEGYEDAPADRGIATTDAEALREQVMRANSAGLACAIHAIGDRAVRFALDAYAAATQLVGRIAEAAGHAPVRLSAPNRIEHAQLVQPEDLARFAPLGVVASMQPIHATSDMEMAAKHWGARCANAYAWRSTLAHGASLALGSDCPVETISPLAGIRAAVTRRRPDGAPGPAGWYPEQRLTVEEALRGYSLGAAFAAGLEERLGSIRAGKLADLTILERDLLAIDPMEIGSVEVLGTVVGGRFAWRHSRLA